MIRPTTAVWLRWSQNHECRLMILAAFLPEDALQSLDPNVAKFDVRTVPEKSDPSAFTLHTGMFLEYFRIRNRAQIRVCDQLSVQRHANPGSFGRDLFGVPFTHRLQRVSPSPESCRTPTRAAEIGFSQPLYFS